jgi:hypothetical protein
MTLTFDQTPAFMWTNDDPDCKSGLRHACQSFIPDRVVRDKKAKWIWVTFRFYYGATPEEARAKAKLDFETVLEAISKREGRVHKQQKGKAQSDLERLTAARVEADEMMGVER